MSSILPYPGGAATQQWVEAYAPSFATFYAVAATKLQQNGNSYAAPVAMGTLDAEPVEIITGGVIAAEWSTTGAQTAYGNIVPSATNSYNLGTSTDVWANVYADTIYAQNEIIVQTEMYSDPLFEINAVPVATVNAGMIIDKATATVAAITSFQIAANVVTVTCANTFSAGQTISIQSVTTATFLQGAQLVVLPGVTGAAFTATFAHANYGPALDTATAVLETFSILARAGATGNTVLSDGYALKPTSSTALGQANGVFELGTLQIDGSASGSSLLSANSTGNIVTSTANLFSANAFQGGVTSTAQSGQTIAMTVASTQNQTCTGSGGITYKLPDASTLGGAGATYAFNNNATSAATIQNSAAGAVTTVPAGGYITCISRTNASPGTWDTHGALPSTISAGTGGQFWTATSSGVMTLAPPVGAITPYTITWPSAQGATGTFLTNSDGAGTLTWTGGNSWLVGGNTASSGALVLGVVSGTSTVTIDSAGSAALTFGASQLATFAGSISVIGGGITAGANGGAGGLLTLEGSSSGSVAFNPGTLGNLTITPAGGKTTHQGYIIVNTSATNPVILAQSSAAYGSTATSGAQITLYTNTGNTALPSGDYLGSLNFSSYTGGAQVTGASITAMASSLWTTGPTAGTNLVFSTCPNASATLTTALTLGQDQSAAFAGAVTVGGTANSATTVLNTVTASGGGFGLTLTPNQMILNSGSASGVSSGIITPVMGTSGAITYMWYNNTPAQYDFWSCSRTFVGGTYTIAVVLTQAGNNGKFAIYVGSTLVATVDGYAGVAGQISGLTGTGVTIGTAGVVTQSTITFRTDAQNASSTGYYFPWMSVSFVRTS